MKHPSKVVSSSSYPLWFKQLAIMRLETSRLNLLSNNFGSDWGRAILFSILVGLSCITALIWTTPQYILHGHLRFGARLVASFARFINPIRFFYLEALFSQNGKTAYVTLTWVSCVLDFITRVFVAYGYY